MGTVFGNGRQVLNFSYAPHRSWRALLTLPVIGVAVALLGPFGSYTSMDIVSRCLHFAVCFTLIGVAVVEGSYLLARRFFSGYWPLWAALLFDVALSVPAAAIVYGSLSVFGPKSLAFVRFSDLIWQNLLLTLMVRAVIITVVLIRTRHMPPEVETAGQVSRDAFPLDERLPFALRGAAVVALSAEDHYLRIYTARGEALIHMTLSEAMEVLGGGFQIHRSHWISGTALKDCDGERVQLVTGLSLPVSRHRRKAFEVWLVEAGVTPSLGPGRGVRDPTNLHLPYPDRTLRGGQDKER